MPTLLPARVAEAAKPSDVPVFLALAMTFVFLVALTIRTPANLEAQGVAGTIYAALQVGI